MFIYLFLEGITDLLSLSLSQENEEYLVISLLLSRQGGMEGGHVFPSYGNWFKVRREREGVRDRGRNGWREGEGEREEKGKGREGGGGTERR